MKKALLVLSLFLLGGCGGFAGRESTVVQV